MQTNIERITQLADSVSASLGLSLVDVKLVQQGKRRTMEVTIYRPGGRIGLDDCEHVSRKLEEALDKEADQVLEGSFDLEVQSPGIDRKLISDREYSLFAGLAVEVKTKQKVEGLGSAFCGKLVGLDNGNVLVAQAGKLSDKPIPRHKLAKAQVAQEKESQNTVSVPLSNIISVRLMPQLGASVTEQADDLAELSKTE